MLTIDAETGIAVCDACGWTGVPTIRREMPSLRSLGVPAGAAVSLSPPVLVLDACPSCEIGPETDAEYAKAGVQALIESGNVGRNEPCPCGSGKKFKKCCGG